LQAMSARRRSKATRVNAPTLSRSASYSLLTAQS
jgi:hypothetical protein